jgi:hypothetical protein
MDRATLMSAREAYARTLQTQTHIIKKIIHTRLALHAHKSHIHACMHYIYLTHVLKHPPHTYTQTYIHTYIHTHTCTHTHIHTYVLTTPPTHTQVRRNASRLHCQQ